MVGGIAMFRTLALSGLVGAAALAAQGAEVFHVDKVVPFPKSGLAALKFEAGPITFEEVVVRNMPDAADLAEAAKDPDDNCHPKLQVGMSNAGPAEMTVKITLRLEGDDGTVYMDCSRTDEVKPGAVNDHTNLCWLDSMKTKDFPKVTKVHIVASVSKG